MSSAINLQKKENNADILRPLRVFPYYPHLRISERERKEIDAAERGKEEKTSALTQELTAAGDLIVYGRGKNMGRGRSSSRWRDRVDAREKPIMTTDGLKGEAVTSRRPTKKLLRRGNCGPRGFASLAKELCAGFREGGCSLTLCREERKMSRGRPLALGVRKKKEFCRGRKEDLHLRRKERLFQDLKQKKKVKSKK